jgi:hypothetical protein
MNIIFQFFKNISENYGITFAILFLIIVLFLYGVFFIIKSFPDVIKDYIEHKLLDNKESHILKATKRKTISPEIIKILSELLLNVNGDRALLFEYSNGTSNLAGLPFVFINATSEVLSINTKSVASIYQRFNISLLADFLLNLENESYFYASDIEEIKYKYPYVYSFMKLNDAKSMLFYTIYGLTEPLGFIVVTTTKDKIFTRKDALPLIAEAAQQISSLLNFKELDSQIEH